MQTHLVVQNPQASRELRIPLTVTANTSKEDVLANVLTNSRAIKRWLKEVPPHDRIAVLCGGGPSLADEYHKIPELRGEAGDVFALNGAARFLNEHGILADYQVLMDAQLASVSLVGPAKQHLFASQVDPQCFTLKPDAILWHATYGEVKVDEQDGFAAYRVKNGIQAPEDAPFDDDYCLIGSSISVGPTALGLLYAMGYRTIHVLGCDCSHSGNKSHAYSQHINDGEPCSIERFNGKSYTCSVAMALSAKYFMERGRILQKLGCNIHVHGYGILPDMWNTPQEDLTEQEKYERIWSIPEYRHCAPGEACVEDFIRIVQPTGTVIDFGCGTGRAALAMKARGLDVVLCDFAPNCRDPEAMDLPFIQVDLTQPIPIAAAYGFCTDVMEHIPSEHVETVIHNIMAAAKTVFFQISTVEDGFGMMINQTLHLTVEKHSWWRFTFARLGYVVAWEEDNGNASQFVITKKD